MTLESEPERNPMIERVLVPLDGSREAEMALGHGVAIATGLEAPVFLLRVVESQGALTDPTVSGVDWRLLKLEAAAYLQEISGRLKGEGVEAATEVVEGKVADEILRFVLKRGLDLVVLAAHGQGGAIDFPFGGTVFKILSSAAASILIVRPPIKNLDSPAEIAYRRILVPVDGSPSSEWAVCLAAGIARKVGAELLVLHVIPEIELLCPRIPCSTEETRLLERLEALRRERADRYFQEMESELCQGDLVGRFRVVRAPQVAEGVQQVAREEGADLIALSAHGASEAAFPYGRVAQRLLARSQIPVLVFQDLPDDEQAQPRQAQKSTG